jgi:hypothetical protein
VQGISGFFVELKTKTLFIDLRLMVKSKGFLARNTKVVQAKGSAVRHAVPHPRCPQSPKLEKHSGVCRFLFSSCRFALASGLVESLETNSRADTMSASFCFKVAIQLKK